MDDPRQLGQWEMHVINVEVNDVEMIGALQHFFQHYEVMGKLILAFVMIQTKGLGATGDQPRSRLGITAGKEGDVVSGVDQCLRKAVAEHSHKEVLPGLFSMILLAVGPSKHRG